MHIGPIHYCAGRNYIHNVHYSAGVDERNLYGNAFSSWEDFFVNPFTSDVISPNRNANHKYMYVHVHVQCSVRRDPKMLVLRVRYQNNQVHHHHKL